MTPATLRLEDVDLTDHNLYVRGEQHAVWRFLRENAPVYKHPQRTGPGFWVVTTYHDVRRISREPQKFISSGGTSTQDLERADTASADYQIMQGSLVITDPPRHTKLRALVNKAFTPQAIAGLEPFVRGVVRGVLDEAIAAQGCDFVADVAARLPFTVICEMLGIPPADRRPLFESLKPMMTIGVDLARDDEANPMKVALALVDYLQRQIDDRRAIPREDMISELVAAEIDGERLSNSDMMAMCVLLFIAGSETTMNSISGGMLALLEYPDQRRRLAGEPELMESAVEEILRWTSPTMVSMVRTATKGVQVNGQKIDPGDKVTLWYGSANRDEAVFEDSERFDVGRNPNDHLAFGFGPHFCLGAQLARLEIRVVFEELLASVKDVRLAGPVARLRSNIFNGLERLPVGFV